MSLCPTARLQHEEAWLTPRRIGIFLLLLSILALTLRLLWIHRFGLVVENEGAGYTSLAENLLAGRGYVGILGDRHTLMPPLFAFLIAGVAPLVGDVESAARLISAVTGAATVWPVYFIVRTMAGTRAGLIAAILVAGHGTLIGFSGATYVEGPYFFALFGATAILIAGVAKPSFGLLGLSGLIYGLAYLLRPETIAYWLLSLVFVVVYERLKHRSSAAIAGRVAALTLAAIVVVAPYAYWLSSTSGYFRLEGKSDSNGIVSLRVGEGMTYEEASRGVSASLEPLGPDLISDQFTIPRPSGSGLVQALQTVFQDPLRRGLRALWLWTRDWNCGGFLLAALAAIGLVTGLKGPPKQRLVPIMVACMTGGYLGLILSIRWFEWDRYIYPFAFFAVLWAAIGISHTAEWGSRLLSRWVAPARVVATVRVGIALGLAGVTSLISLQARYSPMFFQSHDDWALTLRAAGEWIHQHSVHAGYTRPVVMGLSSVVPYYAHGDLAYLPWLAVEEGHRALEYVRRKEPDYLFVRSADAWATPYTQRWLESGIPDTCAQEVKRMSEGKGHYLVIYRWDCAQAAIANPGSAEAR